MAKRISTLGVRCDPETADQARQAAKAAGMSLSEFVRSRLSASPTAVAEGNTPPPSVPPSPTGTPGGLAVYHVDQLGPDGLRRENDALLR